MDNMNVTVNSNHVNKEVDTVIQKKDNDPIILHKKKGLLNVRAFVFLLLWYVFSGCTLFLNKYILTYLNGNPTVLGACQMLTTASCGFIQMYFPCGMYKPSQRLSKPPGFYRHMILVGCTRDWYGPVHFSHFYRIYSAVIITHVIIVGDQFYYLPFNNLFLTVVLGLVALNYVAVSFTETIKSSAPLFTVLISRLLLGEQTGFFVNLSLLPVMSGLALCSANEISFEIHGFIAAMATNLTECLQNVYSKMLISGDKFKYTPAELQFYTSLASVVVQIPASMWLVDIANAERPELRHILYFILNGLFFHFQSITAYVLMDYISPVTHSVANTAKRALLIWFSVIMFDNPVTPLSGLGTFIVIAGVFLYIKAQEYDDRLNTPNLMQRKVRAI